MSFSTIFKIMVTNEVTYEQYMANEYDEYGNPLKDGKLINGMVVNASSVYRDNEMAQPHMIFHTNPQSWCPSGFELKEGHGAHIGVELATYKMGDNNERYLLYSKPVIPRKFKIEIDNTLRYIEEIELYGADKIVGTEYRLLAKVSNQIELKGKYINSILDIQDPIEMPCNSFKLIFRVNSDIIPIGDTIALKKFDIFKDNKTSEELDNEVKPHVHYVKDIMDMPDLTQYLLKPVFSVEDLVDIELLPSDAGKICTVISEASIYMWDGERWVKTNASENPSVDVEGNPIDEVIYKTLTLREHDSVFSIGHVVNSRKLRVEDEDGITWQDESDYVVRNGEISFNKELLPPAKFYPEGLKIYIYLNRPIITNVGQEIYLVAYNDIHGNTEPIGYNGDVPVYDSRRIFRLITNKDGDLTLIYVGLTTDHENEELLLFDGIGILGNFDAVYTLFTDNDGELLFSVGDYDNAYENEETTKDYDYVLIKNEYGVSDFYIDVDNDGNLFTSTVEDVSDFVNIKTFKTELSHESRCVSGNFLNIKAVSV